MPLKGAEEKVAKAMAGFFESRNWSPQWQPVMPDPPDLLFQPLPGERWAVEVTELHQYYRDEDRRETKSRAGFDARVLSMTDRLHASALTGSLTYRLVLLTFPCVDLKELEQRVLALMNGTVGEWDLDGHQTARLVASRGTPGFGSTYGLSGATRGPSGRLLADIRESARLALNERLKDKRAKMEPVSGYTRKILALWGTYWLADSDTIATLLQEFNLAPFDAVLHVTVESQVRVVADPAGLFL